MSYVREVIKLAKELESELILNYDSTKFLYLVSIMNVVFKEKKSYLRLKIEGKGFTIEDAAADFMRKCRNDVLVHITTDKEVYP